MYGKVLILSIFLNISFVKDILFPRLKKKKKSFRISYHPFLLSVFSTLLSNYLFFLLSLCSFLKDNNSLKATPPNFIFYLMSYYYRSEHLYHVISLGVPCIEINEHWRAATGKPASDIAWNLQYPTYEDWYPSTFFRIYLYLMSS